MTRIGAQHSPGSQGVRSARPSGAHPTPNTCRVYQQADGAWRCGWVSAEGVAGRSKRLVSEDAAARYAVMLHTLCGYKVTT